MRQRLRVNLTCIASALIALGVVMVYSTSALYALETTGHTWSLLARHLLALGIGLLGAMWMMRIPYTRLRRWSKPLILGAWLLLCLVLIPAVGSTVGGAQRWFRLGPVSVQPSELTHVILVIYLADVLARRQHVLHQLWRGLMPILLVVGLTIGLILLQPDLGTSVLIASVTAGLLFATRVRWQQLAGLALAAVPLLTFLITSAGYRRRRMLAFMNPWGDPQGSGFQIIQSFIALSSGGLLGVGLGHSTQKLFYLPGAYGDFVFAIIGEELGLLGCLGVIFLFSGLIWYGTRIALHAHDAFGRLLATGLVLTIGLKALINMGVATGLFPTKGLPLPLVSYGGSSLIVSIISIGLLLNVGRNYA